MPALVVAVLLASCGASSQRRAATTGTVLAARIDGPIRQLAMDRRASTAGPASEVGVTLLNGKLHVLGGYVAGVPHSNVHEVFDTTTSHWSLAAPMPVRLDHVGAFAVGGKVYAAGGFGTAGRPTSSLYVYDPGTDRWSDGPPLPSARAAAVAVVVDGKLHLIGGKGPGGDTGEHDVYDPAAGAVVNRKIYVAAGRPGSLAVVEVYDPSTNAWTKLPPLPLARSSLAGAFFQGHFLVIGGEDSAERTVYTEVDSWDPASGQWTRLPPLPTGRQGIGAVSTANEVLVPGGGPTGGGGQQSGQFLELSSS